MTTPATITPETRVSLGGLRLMFGVVAGVITLALGANAWMADKMLGELQRVADSSSRNAAAITDLRITVTKVDTTMAELRKALDADGAETRAHVRDLETRLRALENGK